MKLSRRTRPLAAAAAVAWALMIVAPDRAAAFGAMAVGETGNITTGGVAVGSSRNYANKDAA